MKVVGDSFNACLCVETGGEAEPMDTTTPAGKALEVPPAEVHIEKVEADIVTSPVRKVESQAKQTVDAEVGEADIPTSPTQVAEQPILTCARSKRSRARGSKQDQVHGHLEHSLLD